MEAHSHTEPCAPGFISASQLEGIEDTAGGLYPGLWDPHGQHRILLAKYARCVSSTFFYALVGRDWHHEFLQV